MTREVSIINNLYSQEKNSIFSGSGSNPGFQIAFNWLISLVPSTKINSSVFSLPFITLSLEEYRQDSLCLVLQDLSVFFPVIKFRPCNFGRNITKMMLCSSQFSKSGGTRCLFVRLLVMLIDLTPKLRRCLSCFPRKIKLCPFVINKYHVGRHFYTIPLKTSFSIHWY